MRKYLRALARARMRSDDIQHINRKHLNPKTGRRDLPSFFADNWRRYAANKH